MTTSPEQHSTPPTFAALAKGDPRTPMEIAADEALAALPDTGNGFSKDRLEELKAEGYSLVVEPEDDSGPTVGDIANARRFVQMFGQGIKYVPDWNKWLVWDEHRWNPDVDMLIETMAKATSDAIWDEAKAGNSTELAAEAKRIQSVAGREAMVKTARSDYRVIVHPAALDSDPMLLNSYGNAAIRSGTLDLRTGELRPAKQDDLITKMAAVRYQPNAKCPRWERFLEEIFIKEDGTPDLDLIAYIQRLAGYCLTGSTREEVFAILHGVGRNGKGVFIATLRKLLDTYAHVVTPELLLSSNKNSGPELMSLFGNRLVISQETNDGRKFNEAMVKNITGGDAIGGRGLYEKPWSFDPTFKLMLATNHKPKIEGTDEGIWSRIHLIPFNRVFAPAERDPNLKAKMVEEWPGILNWMIQGSLVWQQRGLDPPPAVLKATEEYRVDSDEMRRFIRDRCNVGDVFKDARILSGDLYRRYQQWAGQEGIDEDRRLSTTAFGKALDALGYPDDRIYSKATQQTERYRLHIGLKEVEW